MQLFIDPTDSRGKVFQLFEQLREAISSGALPPGARLEPSRVLAEELGVSRTTVTDAYARLRVEGYIEGRQGGGSFVSDTATWRGVKPAYGALFASPWTEAERPYVEPSPARRFDLTPGHVDARLFPITDWRRAGARALSESARSLGHYGDPAGPAPLRRVLSAWIARSRGVTATPEQIIVSHGTADAVDLVARAILSPGDLVVVEEPGYPPFAALLRSLDLRVVGVPVDEHGLVVGALPESARLVVVAPSHQYPLGVVLSRERRVALLKWAHRRDVAILEDDFDSEFRYTPRPLEPLHRLDNDGRVVYLGTFSKSLSPALRVGFAVVPSSLARAVRTVAAARGAGVSRFLADTLTEFIESGSFDRHLRRTRREYAHRHRVMLASMHAAGPHLDVISAHAGLHLTALLSDHVDHAALVGALAVRDVAVAMLGRTYRNSAAPAGVIAGFGGIAAAVIPEAIDKLRAAIVEAGG